MQMAGLEKSFMPRKHKESLKEKFDHVLNALWKDGKPLEEDVLPELPKAPLSKEQINGTKDPLDILIEKEPSDK